MIRVDYFLCVPSELSLIDRLTGILTNVYLAVSFNKLIDKEFDGEKTAKEPHM